MDKKSTITFNGAAVVVVIIWLELKYSFSRYNHNQPVTIESISSLNNPNKSVRIKKRWNSIVESEVKDKKSDECQHTLGWLHGGL